MAQFSGVFLVIIGVMIAAIGYLFWRLLRVETDLKQLSERFDQLVARLRENAEQARATSADAVPDMSPQPETSAEPTPVPAASPIPQHFGPPAPPPPPPPPTMFERLGPWLVQNWFYVVSAMSLALAGIFLVQYGVENGLLPPTARVLAALAFGLGLIGAGEVIRRRFGDGEDTTTAYLPSVFSGAGVVTLFGAILSARLLYNLIGPEFALIAMVGAAFLAMVLGWFYGPLLAAVGLLGAFAAPYIVGGESDTPGWLFGYFAVLAGMGLGIDTIKRWTWVSALTLVLAYATGGMLGLFDESVSLHFVLYLTALPLLAMTIPQRSLVPNHYGHMVSDLVHWTGKLRLPYIPVLLFGGAMVASVALMLQVPLSAAEFWLVLGALLVLTLAITLWGSGGAAIQDMAVLPVAGVLFTVWTISRSEVNPVFGEFLRTYSETQEADFPFVVSLLLVIGAGLSFLAAWRSQEGGRLSVPFAFGAVLIGPSMGVILDLFWTPAEVIGAPVWALHAVMLAGLMVWFAASFAKRDGGPGLRTALAVLMALSVIAYALSIVLTFTALTVGLSAMIAIAAWLDRRMNLPQMSWFIIAGLPVISYRLLADPGMTWGFDRATFFEAVLSYGGALAAAASARLLIRPLPRAQTKAVLEAAVAFFAALFACLLLYRAIETLFAGVRSEEFWVMGLYASVWLLAALAQLYSPRPTKSIALLRWTMFAGLALVGVLFLGLATIVFSPLSGDYFSSRVAGPPLLNTLMPGYLLPAVLLAVGGWYITNAPRWVRGTCFVMAIALAVLWVFCVIRHFWVGSGDIGLDKPMSQPELYTYTVALLLTGAGLFYQSLARGHDMMRRAGLVVIGLSVAKVFLIDISGLQGLTRVFSLLVLGLSLAGLAWLNRWAQGRGSSEDQEALDPDG